MRLHGSCHCGAVRFSLEADGPVPYQRCYCSICRKTAGSGGFAVNLSGRAGTLEIEGREAISVYRAAAGRVERAAAGDDGLSPARRHFCSHCGSALWLWDPRWPELVHPFAGAVDTPLPTPSERTHLMTASAAPWVEIPSGPGERRFDRYPDESIADWHRRHGLG